MTCDVLNIQFNNPTIIKKTMPLFDIQSATSNFNRVSKHGYLYNSYAAIYSNLAPPGWAVSSAFTTVASAGDIKEQGTANWQTPNTGATNLYKFSALASGLRFEDGTFTYFNQRAYFWDVYLYDQAAVLFYNTDYYNYGFDLNNGASVRMYKISSDWTEGETLTDADGNVYQTVKIGNQVWTATNWMCTKLADGTPIPKVTDDAEWSALTTPAYCAYNNDESLVYEDVEFITLSNDQNQYVDDAFLAYSVQTNPLKINRIVITCDNEAQSINPIKETIKTMWGDSVETLINIQNYQNPSDANNRTIVIDLDTPIVISANEFIKMDIEPLTSVNMIFEYCQRNELADNTEEIEAIEITENSNIEPIQADLQIVDPSIFEKTNKPPTALQSIVPIIVAGIIVYGIYKVYINFKK